MNHALFRQFTLLDLKPGVSFMEVQNAFRRKAKELHPDVNRADNAHSVFRELLEAYQTLKEHATTVKEDGSPGEIPPLVVSKGGRTPFRHIGEALKVVPKGGTILVEPGRYPEALVVRQDVSIVGDGPVGSVEIVSSHATVVEMRALRVSLRNLVVRASPGRSGAAHFAVAVPEGHLEMVDCDISASLSGVVAHGALTDLVMHRCRIHNCRQAGIYAYDGAHLHLEQCRILGNEEVGLQVDDGAQVKVRTCAIQQGPSDGVVIGENAFGDFDGCDISHHARVGIRIKDGATPVFRRCRIHDCRQNGIVIHNGGASAIEDCDIFANAWKGLRVHSGGRYASRGLVSLYGNGRCSL